MFPASRSTRFFLRYRLQQIRWGTVRLKHFLLFFFPSSFIFYNGQNKNENKESFGGTGEGWGSGEPNNLN